MKCPECGKEVTENSMVCPSCGFEIINSDVVTIKKDENTFIDNTSIIFCKSKRYIGIAFCIIACVMFFCAFARINNEKYSFYKQHYKECMDGYVENITEANNFGGWLSSEYKSIASEYEDMAKEDNIKIWEFRIQSVVLCLFGFTCGIVGYKFFKGRRKWYGISKVS